ncbi:hypothetical protein [Amycolatopsis rifamycinica]|uniref:Uncharacterized protein n=1 Tax=Amycolatopsis rifamycinica TaxID=287986 RepID=A0A066UFG1_9PSEU|nr:hypothetical protein [Amycolatopsis rifamycinica]KDN22958.1 hypothetical protein DV20_06695 [Amycolatopsis rifamycinica]
MPDRITRAAAADGFAELVLADPAWVRAEFDAIVAANFGPPPPPAPAARRGRPRPPGAVGAPRRRPGVRLLAAKCPRRERAPPRLRKAK